MTPMRRVIVESPYSPDDDFARSLEEAYRVIRERMANGGPAWTPKKPKDDGPPRPE